MNNPKATALMLAAFGRRDPPTASERIRAAREKVRIPADFPVQPIDPNDPAAKDPATCGECGLTWDDGISTEWTPTPSARCPFEYFHVYEGEAS
jgi:hypothetical protein